VLQNFNLRSKKCSFVISPFVQWNDWNDSTIFVTVIINFIASVGFYWSNWPSIRTFRSTTFVTWMVACLIPKERRKELSNALKLQLEEEWARWVNCLRYCFLLVLYEIVDKDIAVLCRLTLLFVFHGSAKSSDFKFYFCYSLYISVEQLRFYILSYAVVYLWCPAEMTESLSCWPWNSFMIESFIIA